MARLCTVETAADVIGMEAWRLRDLAVLGGAPQAYGPMRVEGSGFSVMLDLDDVKAWYAAGRPIACRRYATLCGRGNRALERVTNG